MSSSCPETGGADPAIAPPTLTLLEGARTLDAGALAAMYERLTGKRPSESEMAEAREMIISAKGRAAGNSTTKAEGAAILPAAGSAAGSSTADAEVLGLTIPNLGDVRKARVIREWRRLGRMGVPERNRVPLIAKSVDFTQQHIRRLLEKNGLTKKRT